MIEELINHLNRKGIRFSLNGDNLKISADTQISEEDIAIIKENKSLIISYVRQRTIFYDSIPLISTQSDYALSSSQKRLWVMSKFEGASEAYHIPQVFRMSGILNDSVFIRAYQYLLERHEVLRTVFIEDLNGNPRQRILQSSDERFKINVLDYSQESQSDANLSIHNFIVSEVQRGFDMSSGPLIRCSLLLESSNSYIWVLVLHHIVSDGWSMGVLHRDFVELYNSELESRQAFLSDLSIQHKDYAAWHNTQLASDVISDHKKFWLDKFAGELPILDLGSDLPRPKVMTYRGASLYRTLDKSTTDQLRLFGQQQGGTMFMTLQTALNILLHKYTGQEDIVIGSPIAGRDQPELEGQIGFYVNTLPLRNSFSKEDTVAALYQKIKQNTLECYSHQLYPYDELVEALGLMRDVSRNPLFDVMITYQSLDGNDNDVTFLNIEIENYNTTASEYEVAKFDLTFGFDEHIEGISFSINYNIDIYCETHVNRMIDHLEYLLKTLSLHSSIPLSQYDLLSKSEKTFLLETLNSTQASYPENKTIVDLFEAQVERTPEAIAVKYKNIELSYQLLNEYSNQFARYLIDRYQIHADELVGIELDRSEWMIIVILGIMKTGGAYVPIDPAYPEERKNFIRDDAQLKVIVNDNELNKYREVKSKKEYSNSNLNVNLTSENLIYVIYTSGSTGNPKGCMLEHRGLVNYIEWTKKYSIHAEFSEVDFFTSLSFDFTLTSLFGSLLFGKTLRIYSSNEDLSLQLKQIILNENSAWVKLTPAHVSLIETETLKAARSKVFVLGGEALTVEQIKHLRKNRGCTIFNEYGPTEATVGCIVKEISENNMPFIGQSLNNMEVVLLDVGLKLVPFGSVGEICISGIGLARGYINRGALTLEKFIENPYHPGKRLYRTGDLGRWRECGNLEYLGRTDEQVKIRGYRIELGEIEQALSTNSNSGQTCVLARAFNQIGEKELIVYFTGIASAEDLRLHLSSKLPHYMVPKYYVKLEKIPLTNNGKVNKKSLPNPEGTGLERENYVAPKSEEEKILVQLWSDVLRVRKEEIGLASDFFALAGDSIKAILLVARLRNVGYELKTSDVLGNSQLQDMAAKVRLLTREIDQSAVDGEIPLSPIQRAFFSNAIAKGTDDEKQLYHQSFMLSFSNLVSRLEIKIIIDKLLEHHDQLRAKFVRNEEGIWTQWISKENKGYYLIEEEIIPSSLENDKLTIQNFIENKGVFLKNKLSHFSGILIGIGLYHDANQSQVLICMHHLIIDVVSWRILFEDINTLLHQLQSRKELRLPKKTDSYKYWIDRNIEYSNSRFIESELNYWKEQEKVKTDKLQLKNFNGRNAYEDIISMGFSFDRKDTAFIQHVISENRDIEINAFLLSALARAIRDVFDTTKIRINLEGHGREDYISETDSSRTIGWFTSLFPFILNTSQKDVDSIYALQDALNRIPGKGVGYGIIRYLSKSPILDHHDTEVTFNYLGQLDLESQALPINNRPENSSEISLFNLSEYRHGKDVHDNLEMESNLLITGQIANESLQLNIQFSEKRLDVKRIHLLKEKFQMHLYKIGDELSNFHEKRQLPSNFTYKDLSFDVMRELSKQYLEIEDVFPLNGSQLGLLFVSDTEFDSGLYTEQFIDEFKGALNIEKWIHALSQTIDFNQVLRIVFRTDVSSSPVQICLKKFEVNYNFFDISDYFEEERQNKLDDIISNDYSLSFDLRSKPPYRVTFIKLEEDKYIRIWTNHHIIMDGWSSHIFFKQWENFYHGMEIEISKRENKLNPYFKFLAQIDRTISFDFWNKYLQEYEKSISIPPIPVHFSDTNILSQYEFELERHTTKKLIEFAKNNKFTLSSVIQSLFGILLAKLNNTNDVVFASVVSGRPNVVRNIENLIFNFINLIPVRIKYNLEDTFLITIRSVSDFFAQVENHQYLPLNETCKAIPGNGGALKVLFVFENYPTSDDFFQCNSQEEFESKRLQVNDKLEFDITFLCGQEGDSLKFIWKSGTVAYSEEQVNSIFRMLNRFIDLLINESDILVDHTELLDTKERDNMIMISKGKEIIEDFADFATLYEKAVKKYSSLTAISGLERDYSYKELDELSNKFANYLMVDKGLKKGDVVAVELERSEWIPISFLGIAKAGMVFLFVDRSYPDNRISFIKNNSKVQFVLNKSELLSFQDNIGRISGTKRDFSCLESDLLYIIYTSGTTGIPKGCALTHLNMFNLYLYMIHQTELMDSNPKVFQFTTWSFDLSIQEFINALFSGGQLICLSEEDRNDYTRLTNRIVESEASIFYLSPSFLNALMTFEFFVKAKTKLKYLVSAGEQLFISNTLKEYLKYSELIVYNLYGPAETHVVTGRKFLYSDFDKRLDIGLPTCNNQIWILDSCFNILPIGVQGEVFITGDSVGFGYINNLSENAERFIHHNQLGRMYKTGDLAFRDFKGCIHYSGRVDDQVKINGVRIELDEIVKCMKSHVDITNAIALNSTNSNGSKYLASFYTGHLNEFDLRTFLKENLPAIFIPSVIVRLPVMPLNANGKIDKYQLQSILSKERKTKLKKKPVTWLQQELVKILCEVMTLSEEAVDIDMNFDDIGLTSLQYIQYVSLLNIRLGYSLTIKDIINSSSIYELFKFLMKPKNSETGLLYSLTGSFDLYKPVLVLFPAFFGEGLYYLELAKYLKAEYNVFSCNYYSDTNELFDTDFFTKTIIAELKRLGFTRIVLGGASYGFRVAYRVAYYAPTSITRILNFDGSVYDNFEDEKQKIVMINEYEMSTLDKDEILLRQESLTKYFSEDRKLKYQNDYFIGTLKNIEIVNFYPKKSSVKLFSRKDITTGKVIDVSFDGNHENMLTITNNFKKIKDFITSYE